MAVRTLLGIFFVKLNNYLINFCLVILDIQVMLFVGFGFLMTFLRRFGYSAVCFTMLVIAVCVEYVIIVRGFM